MNPKILQRIAFFSLLTVFFGCKYNVRLEMEGAGYCRATKIAQQSAIPGQKSFSNYQNNALLTKRFSNRSLHLAQAYGFIDELEKIVEWERQSGDLNAPIYRRTEHKVNRHIQYAIMDIDASTSELRCYSDRFTEILVEMKGKEDTVVQDNTLFAIVSGALFTILDGATYFDPSINRGIIVTGGVLVSYFSWKAFAPEIVTFFKPKSSILKELWSLPEESENFSKPLWYLITKQMENEKPSIRDILISRWKKNGFLGKNSEEETELINLYFINGGDATIETMSNRKEMVTGIKTMVGLLMQDVRNLQSEMLYFENLDEKKP